MCIDSYIYTYVYREICIPQFYQQTVFNQQMIPLPPKNNDSLITSFAKCYDTEQAQVHHRRRVVPRPTCLKNNTPKLKG